MEKSSHNPVQAEIAEFKSMVKVMPKEEIDAMIKAFENRKSVLATDPDSFQERGWLIIQIAVLYNELNSYRRRFPNSPYAQAE